MKRYVEVMEIAEKPGEETLKQYIKDLCSPRLCEKIEELKKQTFETELSTSLLSSLSFIPENCFISAGAEIMIKVS
jgi:hypothetical protein